MKPRWKKIPDSLRIRYVKRGWGYVQLFEQEWVQTHCDEVINTEWRHVPVEDPRYYER